MEVIGKGSSGYVRKAYRKSTNEVLALKVINVFEVEKRKQMMQEILMMCDARCDSLIRFHGAFYNEGAISVALEYMTAGYRIPT
jgi:serine/threonine protein kinase